MPASELLVEAARAARERAVADYSGFKVGAALETIDGHIITGCNIENATYGLTVCAERVATFKAISEGHRAFRRIVVVADTEVVMANLETVTATLQMRELLPLPFDQRLL